MILIHAWWRRNFDKVMVAWLYAEHVDAYTNSNLWKKKQNKKKETTYSVFVYRDRFHETLSAVVYKQFHKLLVMSLSFLYTLTPLKKHNLVRNLFNSGRKDMPDLTFLMILDPSWIAQYDPIPLLLSVLLVASVHFQRYQ